MPEPMNPDSQPKTVFDAFPREEGKRTIDEPNHAATEQPYKTSSDTKGLMIFLVVGGVLTMGILLLVLPDWSIPLALGGFVGLLIAVKAVLSALHLLRSR